MQGTAAQEQMVTGEARKDGSENLEFTDEDKKSKKNEKRKRRKRKPATEACELKGRDGNLAKARNVKC